MGISGVSLADAAAHSSDSLQAAYYRGALTDYRAVVAVRLRRQAAELNAMSGNADSLAITQMRRQIHDIEAECRELDRMIEGIDRRFASLWASEQ